MPHKTYRSAIANSIHLSTRCSFDSKVSIYFDGFLVHLIRQVGCDLLGEWIHRNSSWPECEVCSYFMFLEFTIRIFTGINHLVGLYGAHTAKLELECWELTDTLTVPKWLDSRRLFWILPGITSQDPAYSSTVRQTSAYLLIASEYCSNVTMSACFSVDQCSLYLKCVPLTGWRRCWPLAYIF